MGFCHTCNEGWTLKTILRNLRVPGNLIDEIVKDLPVVAPKRTVVSQVRRLNFDNPHLPEELLGIYDWCPTSMLNIGFPKELLHEYEIGFDKSMRRITFPLRDHMGNLIGISGRAMSEYAHPKYYFYTDEELGEACPGYKLHKGRSMWNFHRFYATSLEMDVPYLVIVEGFKQALWLVKAGYKNVVSVMGSYLTEEQATLLLRTGAKLYLFLDNDLPGRKATKKVVSMLRKQTPEVYEVQYPEGTDGLSPDDFPEDELQNILMEAINGS